MQGTKGTYGFPCNVCERRTRDYKLNMFDTDAKDHYKATGLICVGHILVSEVGFESEQVGIQGPVA